MWQDLHSQFEPAGLTVVTVALDLDPARARPWIEAASPTHPSLVDSEHRIDELFGVNNVPMAVWIDETGTLVRPAESARLEPNEYAAIEITDEMPEQMRRVIAGLQAAPDFGPAYRAAIGDWVERGRASRFALSPDEVIAASQSRPIEHSRAAACFELGRVLHERGDTDGAVRRWKEAHALYPDNWTYKRQAWTLASTPEGADSDMAQEVQDVYGTSWSEEFLAAGGGATYGIVPQL